jgi:CRISPR-associated protein Csb1
MDFAGLQRIVGEDAAIRRRQVLQPVGGKGDKIFPPTYPAERNNEPPRHVYEKRKLDGREIWCVLVDSVASQANRLEDALSAAIEEGLEIPHLYVDFGKTELADIGRITSLQAPHRVYDAIFRDSLLNGEPFMKSGLGGRLARTGPRNASALLEVAPTSLLFGAWHSTGEGGGLGAKFARCLVSEIVAVDVPVEEPADRRTGEVVPRTLGRRVGSRIDPLGVLRAVEVYKGESGWGTRQEEAGRGAKKVRPSEINHGNIAPSVQPLGITCEHLEHGFVSSCAALRRLGFGGGERDAVGRTLLAALGLLAVAEQDARGYALRSRCDLVCDGAAPFEIVHRDGTRETLALDRETACRLWTEAFDRAKAAGFAFAAGPIRLEPQPKLVEIVKKSRELALAGRGGEAEDGEG